jgi:hypothetical protein
MSQSLKATLRGFVRRLGGILAEEILPEIRQIRLMTDRLTIIAKENYVAQLLSVERYSDPKRLERYGFKVYSQNDEDGIIQEIFRRIGTTDRRFVEFGVENGLESNTLKLLIEGWRGLWLDGDREHIRHIEAKFTPALKDGSLTVRHAFITAENINDLIGDWGSGEVDLLSIDIDGNDFYIWQALRVIKPRVIVIEYNSKFRPPVAIVQEYKADNVWRRTDYMGASLEALRRLGLRLGYSLVATNLIGVNAFFVRSELLLDNFQSPFSTENHYNEPRYFLWPLYVSGHPPDWGNYMQVPEPDQERTACGRSP